MNYLGTVLRICIPCVYAQTREDVIGQIDPTAQSTYCWLDNHSGELDHTVKGNCQ